MPKKILNTRNYRLFDNNSGENRPLDINKHKALLESMQRYGFLEEFPIVVKRRSDGLLGVKDGQHRLAVAETLGLPVYYIESTTDFDVAIINTTSKIWILKDYAMKYAANGVKSYQEGLDFADRFHLNIGAAFALLGGTTTFGNLEEQFKAGGFKVKDRPWADAVAGIYVPLILMSKAVKNVRMLEACMAVCRVKDFEPKRLLSGAERCREKLVSYSNRDSYLDMLEDLYNFGRKQLVGLRSLAVMAMRDRSAVYKSKKSNVRNGRSNDHSDDHSD